MGSVNIGDAELEIMKVLWRAEVPLNSQQIGTAVEEKGWKRTTISTFLTRLIQKGAVYAEKRGNLYFYTPLITRKDYRKAQMSNMIKNLYDGSAREFAVSFFEEEKLNETDIKELKQLLDGMEE